MTGPRELYPMEPLTHHSNVTGERTLLSDVRIIDYPFGKYRVKVLVSPKNEFLGIGEISFAQDFRTVEQKISSVKVHDVEEFYRD